MNEPTPPSPARFWERGRILYYAILVVLVLLWIVLTWPQFRPSLTLSSFVAVQVLGLIANLCYSAAYLADAGIRLVLPSHFWRKARQIIFVLGTVFAIVFAKCWIVDEIYPYEPASQTFLRSTPACGPPISPAT